MLIALTSGGAWAGPCCCAEAEEIEAIAQQKTRQTVGIRILRTSKIATDHTTSIRKLAADATDDTNSGPSGQSTAHKYTSGGGYDNSRAGARNMKRKTLERPPEPEPKIEEIPRWSALLCTAFRFSFLYLGLFCLATQISGSLFQIPTGSFRGFGPLWPMRSITVWIAEHFLGVTEPLVYGRYSGETLFFWVQTLWLGILAAIATVIWSALDRRRENYGMLHKWIRLFIRFALAASMFEYGMTKVIPTQFPRPPLNTLVTPVGDLSSSALLWTTIGSSPVYEIFTGCAELLGGILLIIPRTTTLGALICLADMTQVFVLNMTYDIGVKQISFHLILLSLFLLAPEFKRLANFFVLNRPAAPSDHPQLFSSARGNRIALVVQMMLGVYLVGTYAYINWTYWYAAGDGRPRSPLYGIWNVNQLSIDGQAGPPILNDYDRRWRRVIFDLPDAVAFQRVDDSFARYGASIDVYKDTVALTKGNSKKWKANFTFQRPAGDQLVLDGDMDGHKIHAELQLADFDTFRLLNSRFRWVRPDEP